MLIRNRASATNNADLPMLDEADPTTGGHGREFVAGFEYAGEIAAVGAGVERWQVGDPVLGTFPGAFADYLVADARFVQRRPVGLAPEIACALPTALLTEFGALRVAGFAAGKSVLITGASTGIGLIGVQLAKVLGASQVIATTRTAAKTDLLTGLGADVVIVTADQDLPEAVLEATDGKGADVVLDHIAGQTFAQCLPATAEDGHVVNIGRLAGPASNIDLDALSYRHLTVHGVSFGFSRDWETVPILQAEEAEVLPAVAAGKIRPVIDRTVGVAEFQQVDDRLRSGAAVGKIVLTFDGE
ncbi:quinone oxidoreductase family protein [Granulicoccus phenolivorans]|uniref:quinone oxidoreductase family protein n=1 Tax=Granulicoccus phenolivorans TaxID=266854 RepID=UPI0003FABF89|nr:zinc-binding dehydrogenase [Granulicoccus phenolivorans]